MPVEPDVVVVGAGTAGAAVAALCAQRGLSVVCLDRRPLSESGARWLNGVPFAAFDVAGIARPDGAELAGAGHGFQLVSGWQGPALKFVRETVPEVDMRLLVSRLQGMAADGGAELWGDCRLLSWESGPTGCLVETDRGQLCPEWVVDASGLAGARLLGQPVPAPRDICAAAQQVRRLLDPRAGREFFERHGVEPGTTLSFAGVAGGFSVVNVWMAEDRVGLLTGSVVADGQPSGLQLLERFAESKPWIGEPIFGGARAIPLRRPLERLCRGRAAAVGDAARQVFPAHGSGIGAGLVAAAVLAESLADGDGVEGYNLRWQRRHGGVLAAWDLFRRHSQQLQPDQMAAMMKAGLLDQESVLAAMEQRLPVPSLPGLLGKLVGALRQPAAVLKVAPVFARMAAVIGLYSRYPEGAEAQLRWAGRLAGLFGEELDASWMLHGPLTAAGSGDKSSL